MVFIVFFRFFLPEQTGILLLLAHNNSSGYAIDGILLGVCGILRSLIAPCIRGLSGKVPQEDPVSWRTPPLRRYSRLIINSMFERRAHPRRVGSTAATVDEMPLNV